MSEESGAFDGRRGSRERQLLPRKSHWTGFRASEGRRGCYLDSCREIGKQAKLAESWGEVGTTRGRGIMIGRFNRALMGRITLKKRKLLLCSTWKAHLAGLRLTADSAVYSNAYGKARRFRSDRSLQVMATQKTDAWTYRPTEEEGIPRYSIINPT